MPDSITARISFARTIEPSNPDTGQSISTCFTLSGPGGLDLVLAQDVSNSMNDPVDGEGTRLEVCQAAAMTIVESLPGKDRIAVVAYSNNARLAHTLTTDRGAITRTIAGLTAGGYTNMGAAISLSHQVLVVSEPLSSDSLRAIILLSDGEANCDAEGNCGTDAGTLARAQEYARTQATLAANDAIKIYTIAFAEETGGDLLQEIADIGNGKYFFAPDGKVLETIYETIALELHNLTVTDIVMPGVRVDCTLYPEDICTEGPGGVTTMTWDVGSGSLISGAVRLCYTATVDLDPGYTGPTNLSGSQVCYQDTGEELVCSACVSPTITVGGRKISGRVFYDLNGDGQPGIDEEGAPGVIVRTQSGLTAETDAEGRYLWRTSSAPALSVSLDLPLGYLATTPLPQVVPAVTGIYTVDLGIQYIPAPIYFPLVLRREPLVVNGGFEGGWTGWTHGGQLNRAIVSEDSYTGPYAGRFSARLGDPAYECRNGVPVGSAWVEQTLYVPENRSTLSVQYNIWSQDINPDFDSFDILIDGTLVFRDARREGPYGCEPQMLVGLGWQEAKVDLTPYRGQELVLRLEVRNGSDGWYNTWAYVDQVRLKE